jgi:hypothetical protein
MNAQSCNRARMHAARTCVAFGLAAAILAAMTTLAIASTTRGPSSAIPARALAQMLHGTTATSPRGNSPIVPTRVAVPQSLVGRQLAWLLAEVNGGSVTLTRSELKTHFGSRFLNTVPPKEIVQFLRRASDVHGPISLTGFAGRPSAVSATALITTQAKRSFRIRLSVEGRSHHLITSLSIDVPMRASAR